MSTDLIKPEKTTITPVKGSQIPHEKMTLEEFIKLMGISDVVVIPVKVEYKRRSYSQISMLVQVYSVNNDPAMQIEFNFGDS